MTTVVDFSDCLPPSAEELAFGVAFAEQLLADARARQDAQTSGHDARIGLLVAQVQQIKSVLQTAQQTADLTVKGHAVDQAIQQLQAVLKSALQLPDVRAVAPNALRTFEKRGSATFTSPGDRRASPEEVYRILGSSTLGHSLQFWDQLAELRNRRVQ